MKQFDDDMQIYQQIRNKMEMNPEQLRRVEERLKTARNASAPEHVPPQRAESGSLKSGENAGKPRSLRPFLQPSRILPVAACIMLAVGGGLLLLFADLQRDLPDTAQVSSVPTEEQSVPAQTGTQSADETGTQTASAVQMIDTTAAPPHTTEPPASQTQTETETAAQTDETEPPQAETQTETVPPQTETDLPQTVPPEPTQQTQALTETASEIPQETTEEFAEMTVNPVTETTVNPVAEGCALILPDATAAAGSEITVVAYLTQEISAAGMQYSVTIIPENGENAALCPAITAAESGMGPYLNPVNGAVANIIENQVILIFGQAGNSVLPAGTEVLILHISVPENVPSGTVFRFDAGKTKSQTVDEMLSVLPIDYRFGTLTIE